MVSLTEIRIYKLKILIFSFQMTLYDVLGVSQDASETEIRQQYQELARQYHPDKSGVEGAQEKFLQVTEAWHVLGDTQKRREYDDQLKREKVSGQSLLSGEAEAGAGWNFSMGKSQITNFKTTHLPFPSLSTFSALMYSDPWIIS